MKLTPADTRRLRAAHAARKHQPLGVRTVARMIADKKQWPDRWDIKATQAEHDRRGK